MLTADLLDYRRRAGAVVPRLLDPAAPALLAAAEALLELVRAHVGHPRGELQEALRAATLDDTAREGMTPKTGQGLARLLLERCTFDVAAPVEPAVLREALFTAAAEAWRAEPAARDAAADRTPASPPGSPQWREAVLAQAVAPLGIAVGAVDEALFADLEEQQRLLALEPLRPGELLLRYNSAQVQGLLLRAERVHLAAPWPAPRRLRQLMRYLRFFGLLYRDESAPGRGAAGGAAGGAGRAAGGAAIDEAAEPETLELVLDGPLSVLESSTRYGLNLAQFFPALLLWEPPWSLQAELRLGRSRAVARMRLEPHPWLRSHYPDHGQWQPAEVSRFVAAFNEGPGPWRASDAEALLALPGNRSLVPDFELRRADGVPVYLEYLPWPDAALVASRLEQLAAAGRGDYLLACRGVPALKALQAAHPAAHGLVLFRRTLLPGLVRDALQRSAG